MTKINKIYTAGFCLILVLPLLTVPPYFFPPDWGKTIIFRSIIAILLLLFTYQFFFKREEINLPSIKKNKIIWVLATLFGIYLLATIFSADVYFSLWSSPWRGGGFITFTFYIVFAVLSFFLFKKDDWARVWDISIITGVLVSLVAIIQYYGLFSSIFLAVADRPHATMGNPILLAIYLLLLLFITLSLAIKEKRLWKKICYLAFVMLFLYVILLTGSRAAYLGILAGTIYFFLFYPTFNATTIKKIWALKITTIILLLIAVGIVFYANTIKQYPPLLQNNRLANSILPRLSIGNLIEDTRFAALGIELNMVKARPLLGYGIENFSVGFDRYYDPAAAPSLVGIIAWWDRAHNIVMQTASDAGILGLIAYLALFITIFWKLHKLKSGEKNAGQRTELTLMAHGIQATLIGYFVTMVFSFDSFSTYLIFFLIIGYSLHLADVQRPQAADVGRLQDIKRKVSYKKTILTLSFILLTWFLWQYNVLPLTINAQINKARDLVNQRDCNQALTIMENILPRRSFLDSYVRLEYVEFTKTCAGFYPQNNLTYIKRGLQLIDEAIKIQPTYTRYWIFMARGTNDLAMQEKDANKKSDLIAKATYYLDQAFALAPKHQEIPMEQAKVAITKGDYPLATQYARNCIAVNTKAGGCYFYLGLSQIYVKNTNDAKKNIQLASESYSIDSRENLEQLANAYGSVEDYQNLALVYEKLIAIDPNIAQYHSSLAFFYKQLGRYKEAREQALIVITLSPESKPNVDAFLKTLPR